MLAATIAMTTENTKKFTLLVGNPLRTTTNLFTGWSFVYFHQLTSKNGSAIIEAANAQ